MSRRYDRTGEPYDDADYPTCTRCGGLLLRPESVKRGLCVECSLVSPLKRRRAL
jgi:hypothetical protein